MAAFDWTRWPYDPEDIDPHVIEQACSALKDEAQDGIDRVERATGALDVAASVVESRLRGMGRHGEVLAVLDTANADIRRLLDEAMDAVYRAVSVLDNVRAPN